jgi:AcrR family transcriptional regulator
MGRPPRITREQILEAARRAFTGSGFDATPLADIAATLGVTPAAILRYFPSKQELFTAAMSTREVRVPAALLGLASVDPATDPRTVLRSFAREVIPFIQSIIGSAIAVQMHMRSRQTTLVVPFDTANEEAPPRLALRMLSGYFERAMKAGVIREADPRATALLFMGQLNSYVLIHSLLGMTPVYPLDRYLDELIALWSEGAFLTGVPDVEEDRDRNRRPRRRSGDAAVRPQTTGAEAARPRRNAGGADGERGVARRRPGNKRPRR